MPWYSRLEFDTICYINNNKTVELAIMIDTNDQVISANDRF